MSGSILKRRKLQANMSVSRMRMRLEQQIESNSISGLTWLDKHAAWHGWEFDEDECSYKKRAIHTGEYVEGQSSDSKALKANFRCAMNCLPDLEEVKDESISNGDQAIRVFRMLPSTSEMKQDVEDSSDTEEDSSDTESSLEGSVMEDILSAQSSIIDRIVNLETPDFTFVYPSEVPDFSSAEFQSEDFLDNTCSRFEASPDYSPDCECDDIVKICQQLERGSPPLYGCTRH